MENALCPAPWNALYYKDSVKAYKPCCEFKKLKQFDSLDEYFNSDFLNEVKEDLKQGIYHKHCKACKDKSDMNIKNYAEYLIENIGHADTTKFELKWLDYRPGNLCNLKCRMCSVVNSNAIEKEALEHPIIMEVIPELDKRFFSIEHGNKELLPELIDPEVFKKLKMLQILGGEPTLDPQIFKLLDYIGTLPTVNDISLRYTTNATSVNKRWFNVTKNFKDVDITFSIDGTEDTYDYVRTGADYKKVFENIPTLINRTENFKTGSINIVWSSYNAFTVDKWANDLIDLSNSFDKNINIVVINIMNTDFLSPRFLPNHLKQIVNDKIDLVKDKEVAKQFRHYTNVKVSEEEVNTMSKEFFRYNDALDSVRNTDINNISTLYKEWRAYVE